MKLTIGIIKFMVGFPIRLMLTLVAWPIAWSMGIAGWDDMKQIWHWIP